MQDFYLKVGDEFRFAKTVGESDVYLFAGITGDLSPNHVDESEMAQSAYGGRIAHGALIVGYMSACSTLATAGARASGETPVSLGYDRIRFLRAVRLGDTIRIVYRITEIDPARRRAVADVRVANQRDELVAVATHILKWTANNSQAPASNMDRI